MRSLGQKHFKGFEAKNFKRTGAVFLERERGNIVRERKRLLE